MRTKASYKGLDTRGLTTGPRSSPKRAEVTTFLRKLYFSAAESLPDGFRFAGDLKMDIGDLPRLRQQLLDSLVDSALDGPLLATLGKCMSSKSLPKKHLPPGKPGDIYQLYQASCKLSSIEPASPSVFYDVWRSDWKSVLVFRKASTHTMCSLCHKLKSQIRAARCLQDHLLHCDRLLQHMARQWADRQRYWQLRDQARREKNVLVAICDGMDRSKFALPRWAEGRTPKAAEKLRRPVLELSAVLFHGHGTYVFITDEDTSVGSNWSCEIVMTALDFVYARAKTEGLILPDSFHLQADNTVREVRNSICGGMMAALVSAGYFSETSHGHLQVGHTHEDVDAFFGMVSQILREGDDDIQTPQDIVALLTGKLGHLFAKRNEEFRVVYLTLVRPWKDLLPRVTKMEKVYMTRDNSDDNEKEIPHLFIFKPRKGR